MKLRIMKWGNSLALRIPKDFTSTLGLQNGSKVELTIENNKMIIEPREEVDIYALIDQITDENRPESVWDNVKPVGNEVW